MSSTVIYCDTNFYMDYFYDRKDSIRPLGEFAFQILRRTFGCEFSIVVSDWVIKEIEKNYAADQMENLLMELSKHGKLINISTDKKDIEYAKQLPTHKADALHVALALKAKAKFLVTTNLDDFLPCSDLIDCVLPINL